MGKFKSYLVDALCGLLAYVGARWIYSQEEVFDHLFFELLTFAVIFVLLQILIRGRKLAQKGK